MTLEERGKSHLSTNGLHPPPYGAITSSEAPDSEKPRKSSLLHRSLLHEPSTVVAAKGIHLTLASGETIIDACGGAAVAILGHGNEDVISATTTALHTSPSYIHPGAYTTPAAESLATLLLSYASRYHLVKALFVSSGSEAMDAALKLARQYWVEVASPSTTSRCNLVARRQGYHGSTIGAMSVSSNLPRRVPYEGCLVLGNVTFVGPAYAYQYQHPEETEAGYVARLREELEAEFLRLGPETVMAFVAETVVGATSGCTVAPKGYFSAVREVCDRYGVLLILDEVMCGMGRTGTMFAFEQEGDGVVPDILTVGKGLGGGYAPIAGMLVSERVVEGLARGSGLLNHGQTYHAHPLSCATALAVQRVVERDGLVENCARMGKVLERLLREDMSGCKYVGDIRGRGLFWGIEFVRDKSTKECFEPALEFGYKVQRRAFERGVAIYPGAATMDGVKGDHVLIAPPYNVTEEDLVGVVEVVRSAYQDVEKAIDETGEEQ